MQAAMMVHPADVDAAAPAAIGRTSYEATFIGRPSHASEAPEMGRNALDAATLLTVAIGLLRQQLRADTRIHTNIVEGGESINVIPERARVKVFLRSPDNAYLRGRLYDAVRDCVLGAALATGTTSQFVEVAPAYEPLSSNPVLAEMVTHAFGLVGRPLGSATHSSGAGSTDMGNVSQVLPSIHPYVCIARGEQPHTREFAAATVDPAGDRAVIDGATILATMLVGLLDRPEIVSAAWRARKADDGS